VDINRLKVKCSGVKLEGLCPRIFLNSISEQILICKLCEVRVAAEKHFTAQQHCNTTKHYIPVRTTRTLVFTNVPGAPQSQQTAEFSKYI
jgi:uncharacterized Zn-finger protein